MRRIEFQFPDGRVVRPGGFGRSMKGAYSPRHRHTFDQVRMVLEGGENFGPLRAHEGDCLYFPEGVFYGPQEHTTEYASIMLIQTQGPSWGPFPTYPQLDVAFAAMQGKEGVFDRPSGKFRWKSGREQDGFEAMLEYLIGGEAQYPEPRYHSPVMLRSLNFPWKSLPGAKHAQIKPLAGFNGTGPFLEMWRLEPGADFPKSESARNRMLTLLTGSVTFKGQSATPGTYFFCPPGSVFDGLRADSDAELLTLEFETHQ